MDELETGRSGFMIAVVIFWLLAAGACGTAFVFWQDNAACELRTEEMNAEADRLKREVLPPLEGAVDKLRRTLDSNATEDQAAIDSAKAKCGDAPHIDAALAAADRKNSDLRVRIQVLTSKKTDLDQHLARVTAEREAADRTLSAKIADIERRTRERTALADTRVAQLTTQLTALTTRIDAFEAESTSAHDAMRRDRIEYETKRKILLDKIRDAKNELRLILPFRPRIVGTVVGANMALEFAYVNLGSEDGVKPGMRFSIYAPDAVFRPGMKPKGTLEIKRVEATRSQARVVKYNLIDPVVTGDRLVNVAFDRSGRKPTFVLIRFLDIDNDNVDDRDDIIKMIESQGGEVLPPHPDYVDVNADFIVIGEEWDYLANPKEKVFHDRDEAIMSKADRRSVTQLDVDTFLNFIGFPKWK